MWYMIRHGQTLENKLSIQQGQIDTLLSLKGIVQAQSIGYRLLDFNENFEEYEFISSPLARTRHTLQIIIEILNISNAKIITEPLLINRGKGILEGKFKNQIEDLFIKECKEKEKEDWNYIPPEATESRYNAYERILKFIDKYKNHKNLIIVSHSGMLKMLRETLSGKTFEEIKSNNKLDKNQNYFYRWDEKNIEKF